MSRCVQSECFSLARRIELSPRGLTEEATGFAAQCPLLQRVSVAAAAAAKDRFPPFSAKDLMRKTLTQIGGVSGDHITNEETEDAEKQLQRKADHRRPEAYEPIWRQTIGRSLMLLVGLLSLFWLDEAFKALWANTKYLPPDCRLV